MRAEAAMANGDERSNVTGAATGALVAGPVALIVGLLGGLVVGGLLAWALLPRTEVEKVREMSPEELTAACAATEAPPEGDELAAAQGKVATLERDVATKERRVKELETEMARRAEKGKELVAELQRVKAELQTAKEALVVAEQEKERLLVELTETQEQLATRTVERDQAREDALFNRWQDFLKEAQLEICDKGNRKKLGNCRETVEATLSVQVRQDKYAHCIRSKQAEPLVKERVDDKEPLPAYAEMIDEEQKQTKGWMVIFCDPTLPEADDASLAEGRL
jgi:chromosome segregation ATPase